MPAGPGRVTILAMELSVKTQQAFAKVASQVANRPALAGFDAAIEDGQLGGHGVAHTQALAAFGLKTRFLGQHPSIPTTDATEKASADPVDAADPWSTFAGSYRALAPKLASTSLSYDALLSGSSEGNVIDALSRAELFVFAGWDRLDHYPEMLEAMLERAFQHLGDLTPRTFLFELNDDDRRPQHELLTTLQLFRRYQARGHAILCLGEREAQAAAQALDLGGWQVEDLAGRRLGAQRLRTELQIGAVAIAGISGCALARREGEAAFNSPAAAEEASAALFVEAAFNAALGLTRLLGLSVEASLECAAFAADYSQTKGQFATRDSMMA